MSERAQLLRRLRKIDPKAADWLRDEAPKLGEKINYADYYSLDGIMIWDCTPQGQAYWSKLSAKLEEDI